MAIPTEISAAAILVTFWDDNVSKRSKIVLAARAASILTHIPFGSPTTLRLTSL